MLFRSKLVSIATATLLSLVGPFFPVFVVHAGLVQTQQDQAGALNQEAWRLLRQHEWVKALQVFQQALSSHRKLDDLIGASESITGIVICLDNLGQYQNALESAQEGLEIARKAKNRWSEARLLLSLGEIHYYHLKNYTKALWYSQQALDIYKGRGGLIESYSLAVIGNSWFALGDYSLALEHLQKSISITRGTNDLFVESYILDSLGKIYFSSKEYSKALEILQQSLTVSRQAGNRWVERETLSMIGEVLEKQKQPLLAIVFLKEAVNLTEEFRKKLRTLSKEQQTAYTKTVSSTYRKLADLLFQQDRVLEAQQVLDLLKVQELEDYLRNVRAPEQPLYELPPEQEILKKYNELQKTAIQLGQELNTLRQLPEASRTPVQQQRIEQLVQLQEALNQQFNQFTGRDDVVALVKQLSPTVLRQTVDLAELDGLRDDLRQLDAVLLYPLILEDRLELVITTPDSPPLRRTIKVKRTEINAAIVEFRQALNAPGSDAKVPAQKLYEWLIKPLEADLKQAKARTIIYAPDGQLRYIPLAALYDGQQWLVQRYRINNITAKSFTEFKTQPISQPHVLAGAFVQGKYTVQAGDRNLSFTGLPFAGKEVDTLATLLSNTTKLIDQSFSRATVTRKMNEYNIVHLATHASFVPGAAVNSFILFGNGDKATLKDIESWTLNNVDLVVLSACETGLGNNLGNGEEILGLGYQFQNRGAKATIASLWQVDDGGTQVLMNAFYGALKQGMTKIQALQTAQTALITGNYTTVGGKRSDIEIADSRTGQSRTVNSNTLQHPYYWAPFILIGNGL